MAGGGCAGACVCKGVVGAGVAACWSLVSWRENVCPLPQWDRIAHHGDTPTAPSSSHDGSGDAGITHTQIHCSGRPCGVHELAHPPLRRAAGHYSRAVRYRDSVSQPAPQPCNYAGLCRSHRTVGSRTLQISRSNRRPRRWREHCADSPLP